MLACLGGSRRSRIVNHRTLTLLASTLAIWCGGSMSTAQAAFCDIATAAASQLQHTAEKMAALDRRIADGPAGSTTVAVREFEDLERARLYESRRARDIRVIVEAKRLAEASAHADGAARAPALREDEFLGAMLREMRETMPVDPREFYAPESNSSVCTLETALRSAAARALGTVASMQGFAQVKATLNQLVGKYGRPLEPDHMNAADRARFTTMLLPVIHEAQVNTAIAADLIRLAHLESASRMLWAAHRENRFGASLREWRVTANLSSDQTAAACVIDVIDEEFPAETALITSTSARSHAAATPAGLSAK
jgi:hypothetical protein